MALSINIKSSDTKPQIFPRRIQPFQRSQIPQQESSDPKRLERKKKIKKIGLILGLLLLGIGGFYAFKFYQLADNLGLKIKAEDIFNTKEPELKKDSTGRYTGVMIIGIDSGRAAGDGNMNTDTIMVANYNYETNETVMISIPRDFAVESPNQSGVFHKINATYAYGERIEKGKGLEDLKKVVKSVTGIEVQYYGMVDLQGFRKVIDAVGGVVVNVENTFTDYCYPAEKDSLNKQMRRCNGAMYLTEAVTFQKGPQLMDGKTALKYARSRLSGDLNEGGDYARARRQQRVVSSLRDTLLSSNTYLNPQKILELISAVQGNIKLSDFTTTDIQAGINLVQKQSENAGKTYSFVLDPSIGNLGIITDRGFPSYLGSTSGPKLGLGNYTQIKEIVGMYIKNPAIYSEDAIIFVYNNGIGYQEAYNKAEDLKKQFPYIDIRFMGNSGFVKVGTVVYDQTDGTKKASLTKLAELLTTEDTIRPDYITSTLYGEDITILLGQKPEPVVESEDIN